MLNGISHRTPALLAIAVTGVLAWSGRAPALASCAPGAADKPDLGFVDSNCDGIDGDKSAALFVSPAGNDGNNGSFGQPMATVSAAVTKALAAGKDVYVAAGLYDGKLAFVSSSGHTGVYGGYDPQTWQRSAANVTTLEAPGQVVGVGIPGIVLQLLTIHSTNTTGTGSSYGVRAFGVNGSVALSRVTVVTFNGDNGADGAVSPDAPATSPAGHQGTHSCDYVGAAGGQGGGALAGGYGGAFYATGNQYTGQDGMGEGSVYGGFGGQFAEQNGQPGGAGLQGVPGQGGAADLNRVALFFQAMPGSDGTGGTRGGGGGGGAGSEDPCLVGSGGGSGGLPGIGGKGGKGGGGSIGVFAGTGAQVLVLDGSVIHTGNGGKGGVGMAGQGGGKGGPGGAAGLYTYGAYVSHSGAGGDGGYGGHGGQGGGGAGGPSIGVLAIDSRAIVGADTAITLGAGGKGGYGGYDGKPGVAQAIAQVGTSGGAIVAAGDFDGDGVDDANDACPLAAGPGTGCPAAADTPSGPIAGDPGATTGSGSGTATAASATVLPAASCVARRVFTIRINARQAHIKTARLMFDGHRLKLVKGKRRWTARVDLRHSTRAIHTLTIRGKLRNGRRYKQTRHYATCAK